MRKLLALLMFGMLIFGAFLPPGAQAHASEASVISETHNIVEIADDKASMKCCQKSETSMEHRPGSCAMDCHFLPVFLQSQTPPILATVHGSVQLGLERQLVYFPMRPPISI